MKDKHASSAFPRLVNQMQQGYDYTYRYSPTLAEAFWRIFIAFLTPLIALKGLVYRTPLRALAHANVPWTRLAVIALIGFVLLKKDLNLSFDLRSPFAFMADDTNGDSEEVALSDATRNALAKQVSNDYAPVDADDLLETQTKSYIKEYAELAVTEMHRTGIPASIKMAQAIIESRAGTSRLAEGNNNHFGIKCFSRSCPKGHCTNHNDDHHKDFFRKYQKVADSWKAHSFFLQKDRYKSLFKFGKDYHKWAAGLRKAGYATDKTYDKKLINTIDKFQLYKLDDVAL
jgi:hypothetical protein